MARVMPEGFWDLSSQIFQSICENEGFEISRHRLLTATSKDLSYSNPQRDDFVLSHCILDCM